VLRAYLTDAKRCYIHAHRTVRTLCARCKTPYCDECLETRTEGIFARIVEQDEKHPEPLFCARCVEELEILEAQEALRHRPLWQRLIASEATLRRAAIYTVVAAVILVPLGIAARSVASTTLSPEELARFKVGAAGGFQSVEGTNFLSTVYGGKYIRATAPSQPDHTPTRLIDTWVTAEVPGWRSQDATLPVDMVFELPNTLKVSKAILRPQPDEPPATWVKDFDVLVSTKSADDGFQSVRRGSVGVDDLRKAIDENAPDQPRFEFPEAAARWVMLRILANQGSREYTSLGEFEVYYLKK
jgi:hypothetical protein